jgi:hypothetical protein
MALMRVLHRLTAAFTTVLLLQLTLSGSGTLCTVQGGVTPAGMAGMARMAGTHETHRANPAAGSASSRSQSPSSDPAAPQSCDGARVGGGCGQPWAPGQCIGMTTCAALAAPTNAVVVRVTLFASAPALPEPAGIVSGPAVAPELPPPRA